MERTGNIPNGGNASVSGRVCVTCGHFKHAQDSGQLGYTGVRWDGDALFASVVVQTSLSIYWGLLGFAGMIWGARRKQRPVWLAGAGFMALVVVKLFLVDLGNTGTVERIISFMGIGALLLVVGYFAPAPPRVVAESNPQGNAGSDIEGA